MSRSNSVLIYGAKKLPRRKHTVVRSPVSAHRRKSWASICRSSHAAALQASVSASASSVVISNAEVTLATVHTMLSSWMTKKVITVEKRQAEGNSAAISSRRLTRTAQALLPKSSQTVDDLEAILRRIVILNPKTIACMIQATKTPDTSSWAQSMY